ncbi:MAG: L,D-transpeptidase family protein [Methylococcales bacterium]|nr:L,D-transpeptidase family protein [Methylococcales bacterium]MDD5633206.1 L,D-transpeptidase family protein [Methylococcales bacterium]
MSDYNKSTSPFIQLLGVILLSILTSGCQHLKFFPDATENVATPELRPEAKTKATTIETHEFQISDDQAMVGKIAAVYTRENDTLSDIARHFGLGYNDISKANPAIAPWTPAPDSRVLLPLQFILPDAPHKGIILNLANMRLFYYPKQPPGKVFTYPVGIGRQGWSTPMGLTSIVAKKANPTWVVPASIHQEHAQKGDSLPSVVAAGPNNPLGLYAMRLGFPRYLIHGTNKPYGIGMQISHGCVQLYPEDIEILFKNASLGMPVRIVHQPYLTAWHEDMLYLEANEPLQKWTQDKGRLKKQLLKQLRQVSSKRNVAIDWEKVDSIIERSDGIPTPILKQSPDVTDIAANAVQLEHPEKLYQQPVVGELKDSDWSILVASFDSELEAQELTTMLNHQGPIIPARKIKKNNAYQVIAGPFKNKKEVNAIAKRIRMDFEIDVEPLKPLSISGN